MKKLIRLWAQILLLPVLIAAPCFSADYFSSIKEAITNIELGAYEKASVSAEHAVTLNDSESLGHMTLGVIYMHASRSSDAIHEFKLASAASPNDWRPFYAMGVMAAGQKNWTDSRKFFSQALKSPGARDELIGVDQYLAYTLPNWKRMTELTDTSDSPLSLEVAGIHAYKSKDYVSAARLLSRMLETAAPLGFYENRSPMATFDPLHSVSMPKGKLPNKKLVSKSIPRVTGRVMLRADTSRTSRPSFVSFFVDDSLAGMTNYAPFEFEWDTGRYTNGVHEIRIEAKNDADQVISNKTLQVQVSNSDTSLADTGDNRESGGFEDQLIGSFRIVECRKLAHYYLAKTYIATGDRVRAGEELRFALAYQPDFEDAARLLKEVDGTHPYHEIYHGRPGSKEICISFDDGPNERTEQLLSVLKKLDVHATFFLVGFMAEAHPDLVREIQADGHDIENHTYDHYRLTDMSASQTAIELAKGASVVEAITGKRSMYFRPPGGHSTAATRTAAAQLGLTGVFWSILCSPYEGARYQALADHVINNAKGGDVILMHNGEPATMSALARIVSALRAKGFRFVTIPELDPAHR